MLAIGDRELAFRLGYLTRRSSSLFWRLFKTWSQLRFLCFSKIFCYPWGKGRSRCCESSSSAQRGEREYKGRTEWWRKKTNRIGLKYTLYLPLTQVSSSSRSQTVLWSDSLYTWCTSHLSPSIVHNAQSQIFLAGTSHQPKYSTILNPGVPTPLHPSCGCCWWVFLRRICMYLGIRD